MAKVKSIKFYNFVQPSNVSHGCIHVNFYDTNNKLISLDFSNRISPANIITTYCETLEYIVTSDSSENSGANCNYNSFHTGNFDKTIGSSRIGDIWLPSGRAYNSSNWLKIEFKLPQDFSSIKVSGTIVNYAITKSFSYDVEYEDNIIKTYNFGFDYDTPIPIGLSTYRSQTYDQNFMNSYLRDIQFKKYIYDTEIGYVETLDTNNFRNIPVSAVKRLKSLCINPSNTHLNCLISFDKKQTWKIYDGASWNVISDISPENIILNGMELKDIDQLDKNKLIAGGFIGDIDFKIAMKTNDVNKTPSVTKIYIEYK